MGLTSTISWFRPPNQCRSPSLQVKLVPNQLSTTWLGAPRQLRLQLTALLPHRKGLPTKLNSASTVRSGNWLAKLTHTIKTARWITRRMRVLLANNQWTCSLPARILYCKLWISRTLNRRDWRLSNSKWRSIMKTLLILVMSMIWMTRSCVRSMRVRSSLSCGPLNQPHRVTVWGVQPIWANRRTSMRRCAPYSLTGSSRSTSNSNSYPKAFTSLSTSLIGT